MIDFVSKWDMNYKIRQKSFSIFCRCLLLFIVFFVNIDMKSQSFIVYSNADDGFVNIRKEPNAKADILSALYNGKEGANLLEGGNKYWYKVEKDGVIGYVNKRFVKLKKSTNSQPTTQDINRELDKLDRGMTMDECRRILGEPDDKSKRSTEGHIFEQWFYYNKYYLKFDNGFLIVYANINNYKKNLKLIQDYYKK